MMNKTIVSLQNAKPLKKEELKNILGGGGHEPIGCGCDCAGRVTGPKLCQLYWNCPQVYNCVEPPIK